MENTLRIGDRVMVNKVVYHLRDIKRGDVVVFDGLDSFTPEVSIPQPTNPIAKALGWFGGLVGFAPPSEKDFIKRVIGIPGDRVVCCDAKGRVTVNGVALTEPYVFPGDAPSDQPFDVTVPEGRLWVMGDHRGASSDSRAHLGDPGGGTVPENKVIGRAFVIIWPVGHWAWLSNPSTYDQSGLSKSRPGVQPPLATPFSGPLGASAIVVGAPSLPSSWRSGAGAVAGQSRLTRAPLGTVPAGLVHDVERTSVPRRPCSTAPTLSCCSVRWMPSTPALGTWWELPGGGMEPASRWRRPRRASWARRPASPWRPRRSGRPVGAARRPICAAGRRILQHEYVLLARIELVAPEPAREGRTPEELEDYVGHRWWPLEDIVTRCRPVLPRSTARSSSGPFLAGERIDEAFEWWN